MTQKMSMMCAGGRKLPGGGFALPGIGFGAGFCRVAASPYPAYGIDAFFAMRH
jgi:hypothetical protein